MAFEGNIPGVSIPGSGNSPPAPISGFTPLSPTGISPSVGGGPSVPSSNGPELIGPKDGSLYRKKWWHIYLRVKDINSNFLYGFTSINPSNINSNVNSFIKAYSVSQTCSDNGEVSVPVNSYLDVAPDAPGYFLVKPTQTILNSIAKTINSTSEVLNTQNNKKYQFDIYAAYDSADTACNGTTPDSLDTRVFNSYTNSNAFIYKINSIPLIENIGCCEITPPENNESSGNGDNGPVNPDPNTPIISSCVKTYYLISNNDNTHEIFLYDYNLDTISSLGKIKDTQGNLYLLAVDSIFIDSTGKLFAITNGNIVQLSYNGTMLATYSINSTVGNFDITPSTESKNHSGAFNPYDGKFYIYSVITNRLSRLRLNGTLFTVENSVLLPGQDETNYLSNLSFGPNGELYCIQNTSNDDVYFIKYSTDLINRTVLNNDFRSNTSLVYKGFDFIYINDTDVEPITIAIDEESNIEEINEVNGGYLSSLNSGTESNIKQLVSCKITATTPDPGGSEQAAYVQSDGPWTLVFALSRQSANYEKAKDIAREIINNNTISVNTPFSICMGSSYQENPPIPPIEYTSRTQALNGINNLDSIFSSNPVALRTTFQQIRSLSNQKSLIIFVDNWDYTTALDYALESQCVVGNNIDISNVICYQSMRVNISISWNDYSALFRNPEVIMYVIGINADQNWETYIYQYMGNDLSSGGYYRINI